MIGPLFIKVIAAPGVPGNNKALALCAANGEIIGKQISCVVENEVNCIGIVTVKFYIDGETIDFAADVETLA